MKYFSTVAYSDTPHTSNLYCLNTELFSVEVDPVDRASYKARAEVAALGSLGISRIYSNAVIVERKNEDIVSSEFRRFSFITVLQGELIISHYLGTSEVKAGHFILLDNSYPRSLFVPENVDMLLISLPRIVLERYLTNPALHEGLVLNADQAPSSPDSPLFGLLASSWEKLKTGSLRDFAPVLSDKLLSNIAETYASHVHHHSSKKAIRITQAKELIEEKLNDPEFSVEGLAGLMEVSSRYLRALFSSNEKISHYFLRRRLEECAKQLAEPKHQDMSITAIAFKNGFNSMAHFSRAFKKAYSLTPRDYRKQHMH